MRFLFRPISFKVDLRFSVVVTSPWQDEFEEGGRRLQLIFSYNEEYGSRHVSVSKWFGVTSIKHLHLIPVPYWSASNRQDGRNIGSIPLLLNACEIALPFPNLRKGQSFDFPRFLGLWREPEIVVCHVLRNDKIHVDSYYQRLDQQNVLSSGLLFENVFSHWFHVMISNVPRLGCHFWDSVSIWTRVTYQGGGSVRKPTHTTICDQRQAKRPCISTPLLICDVPTNPVGDQCSPSP